MSIQPRPVSPEDDDDLAEREALLAAVACGDADIAAGQVVPHGQVRAWLSDMAAGGNAPLPQPDETR